MILKLNMGHRVLEVLKVYINDPIMLTLTFLRQCQNVRICSLSLYQAQMSGEHLQDHWPCLIMTFVTHSLVFRLSIDIARILNSD